MLKIELIDLIKIMLIMTYFLTNSINSNIYRTLFENRHNILYILYILIENTLKKY